MVGSLCGRGGRIWVEVTTGGGGVGVTVGAGRRIGVLEGGGGVVWEGAYEEGEAGSRAEERISQTIHPTHSGYEWTSHISSLTKPFRKL